MPKHARGRRKAPPSPLKDGGGGSRRHLVREQTKRNLRCGRSTCRPLQWRAAMETQIRLTDLASCGGCAAKYSAARLEELLQGFVPADSDDLLVGLAPDDDFAMGGTPLLALSIAAFPEELPVEMLAAIFAAADTQVRAAGGLLAGGHTIRDAEPKYGLAVVGTVHPAGIWPKSGAKPADSLFITKPLGTGVVMTGFKRGRTGTQPLERAVRWMRTLNRDAADALRPFRPNAVTDVTGFGLFGHAHEMASRSGVRIVLESARFPAIDGALDSIRSGVRTSGDPRNRDFAAAHVTIDGAPETL